MKKRKLRISVMVGTVSLAGRVDDHVRFKAVVLSDATVENVNEAIADMVDCIESGLKESFTVKGGR